MQEPNTRNLNSPVRECSQSVQILGGDTETKALSVKITRHAVLDILVKAGTSAICRDILANLAAGIWTTDNILQSRQTHASHVNLLQLISLRLKDQDGLLHMDCQMMDVADGTLLIRHETFMHWSHMKLPSARVTWRVHAFGIGSN